MRVVQGLMRPFSTYIVFYRRVRVEGLRLKVTAIFATQDVEMHTGIV